MIMFKPGEAWSSGSEFERDFADFFAAHGKDCTIIEPSGGSGESIILLSNVESLTQMKDMTNKPSPYIVSGITDQWQKISIPFEKFRRITDWSATNEIVMVFDDINSSPKTGALYVDQVTFEKQ